LVGLLVGRGVRVTVGERVGRYVLLGFFSSRFVGNCVGDSVGCSVGDDVVGLAVGADVGFLVGFLVGACVGLAVGAKVGFMVGRGVGALVGFLVGRGVGALVGFMVGGSVGFGAKVGFLVGGSVGFLLGRGVGSLVGFFVFMGVGALLGFSVVGLLVPWGGLGFKSRAGPANEASFPASGPSPGACAPSACAPTRPSNNSSTTTRRIAPGQAQPLRDTNSTPWQAPPNLLPFPNQLCPCKLESHAVLLRASSVKASSAPRLWLPPVE
jgi:hypothetical protein